MSIRLLSYLRGAVTRLRTSDLEAMLAFLAEANSIDAPEPFPRSLLAALRRLIPGDFASYCELDHARKIPIWSDNYPVIGNDDVDAELEIYWRLRPSIRSVASRRDRPILGPEDFGLRKQGGAPPARDLLGVLSALGDRVSAEHRARRSALAHEGLIFTRARGRDYTERDRRISTFCVRTWRGSTKRRTSAGRRARPSLSSTEPTRRLSCSSAPTRSPMPRLRHSACLRPIFGEQRPFTARNRRVASRAAQDLQP